jgi:DUF4097 and DUF4098 domain-containing protein YvlB
MMRHEPPRRTVLAGAGAALATLSGCLTAASREEVTETETRRFDVSTETTLAVDNVTGPVTVEATDGGQVTVDIERTGTERALDDVTVSTTRASGRLEVETEADGSGLEAADAATVALRVACPGDVAVDHVATTNGDVTTRDVAGMVSLRTTNGAIDASGHETVGDVTTTNGDIDVTVPAIESDTEIESTNGGVTARLGPSLDADVTAQTTNGTVTTEGGLGLSRVDDGVSGALGGGTHDLTIETTNADIGLVDAAE